jgi:hypothetical protein
MPELCMKLCIDRVSPMPPFGQRHQKHWILRYRTIDRLSFYPQLLFLLQMRSLWQAAMDEIQSGGPLRQSTSNDKAAGSITHGFYSCG